jgi:hypothetical protein
LSPEDVLQFLSCVQSIKHRTILTTLLVEDLTAHKTAALRTELIEGRAAPKPRVLWPKRSYFTGLTFINKKRGAAPRVS